MPATLTIKDARGAEVARFASDDQAAGPARKPGAAAGLNRFVWDLKHAAPTRLDLSLRQLRVAPLATEGEGTAGPARKGKLVVKLRRDSSTCEAERVVSQKPSNGSMMAEPPITTCSCEVELASS